MIRAVGSYEMKREPAECTPGREPGWYVVDRARIVAYCDTEEEARFVLTTFENLGELFEAASLKA